MGKPTVRFDREWGWKFASNLEVHGLVFAVERAVKAGATPREIELKIEQLVRQS